MLSGKLLAVCDNCIEHYDGSVAFWEKAAHFLNERYTPEEALLCYDVLENILLGGLPV